MRALGFKQTGSLWWLDVPATHLLNPKMLRIAGYINDVVFPVSPATVP